MRSKVKASEQIGPVTDLVSLVPKETLEKVLSAALRNGGDFAEVYVQQSRSMSIPLEERKIRSAEVRVGHGAGIRVISGEKTGYAYSDDLSLQSLIEAARTAAHIAEGPEVDRAVYVQPVTSAPRHYVVQFSAQDCQVGDKTALLKRANKAAYAYDPRIKQVDVTYGDDQRDLLIANSEGLLISDRESMLRVMVSCIAEEKGVTRDGRNGGGGRIGMEYFDLVTPEQIAREAARVAVVQLDAKPAPSGLMPVVIGNGWGGVLFHEAVGHGLEADFVRKDTSIYTGRLGEKVASEICTVVDDATFANRRGSYNMDDEGTPAQRTVLIEKGVLRGYMTDRLSGGLMGMPLTGNGRRQSYQDIPCPRMSCFFMEAGESAPEEIIASVDHGVFAKNFSGGQVDITSGNFVFTITEAYMIENGRLGAPIKGATLVGNGPDVLSKITMVGSDLALDPGIGTCGKNGQSVPSTVGMPTVKVSELTVGGTG